MGQAVGSLDVRQEAAYGGVGEVLAGHADGGEGRDGVLGEVDVVEADEGEVVGDLEAGFEECVLDADGGHVVGAHDGGGPVFEGEDFFHGVASAVEGVGAFDEPCGVNIEASDAHAVDEGGLAIFGGAQEKWAADEGDFAVAEDGEVLDGLVDAGAIVDDDGLVVGLLGADIDGDDGDIFLGEAIEEELFDAEGHDGDAVDLALEHASGADLHGACLVVGGADEDLVSACDGDLFELLDELGKEGVGDLGDDEAEELAFAGDEGACLGIGKVVELADGLPDACCEDGVDGWNVIDGAGDGGDGDFGVGGDPADVDPGCTSAFCRTFHSRTFPQRFIIAAE